MPFDIKVPRDGSPAAWINEGLSDEGGSVSSFVPGCFTSYARALHPASTLEGTFVTWSDVAAKEGLRVDGDTLWHSTDGSQRWGKSIGAKWQGGAPQVSLPRAMLMQLCFLLEQHSQPDEKCFFGLWDGWGRSEYRKLWQLIETPHGTKLSLAKGDSAPRFGVPPSAGRDYFLVSGPVRVAVELVDIGLNAPNFIWPADQSWLVVSDIDLDSTLVGGDDALTQSIVSSKELEAFRISQDVPLIGDPTHP